VLNDDMSHDLIQGQGQGHDTLRFRNSSILKLHLLADLQYRLENDYCFLN